MSVEFYAVNNDGELVEWPDRIPADTLEVTIHAEEASVGNSSIVVRDTDAGFNVRGHRLVYFRVPRAADDPWFGIIGPFYVNRRQVRRELETTGASRTWIVSLDDVNTLLSRRVQKGTDAKRDEEDDDERLDWLINTAEVIGGVGDSGFAIEDTDFVFTDTPVAMSESDYRGVDSAQVINDLLQQSGKNCYLFNSPTSAGTPIRIGIWYGRTEREDFSSPHRISNVLSDISSEVLDPAWMFDPTVDYETDEFTFPPSRDAELDRDPSRVYSGAYVNYDPQGGGPGYAYETRVETREDYAARDGVFQAELVKSEAKASARALRYLRDLKNEDDAITCAVIVPDALVHAWLPGHRVQVKFSHLPGYESFVWMRVAAVTYRQLSRDSGLWELALDLRGEEPPEVGEAGNPGAGGVFGILHHGSSGEATGGVLHWAHSGDEADILTHGYPSQPTTGLIEEIVDGSPPLAPWPYLGWEVTGTGTVDVTMYATVIGVVLASTHTITWSILKNGVTIASESVVVSSASNISLVDIPGFEVPEITVAGVSVEPDDELTGSVICTPPMYAFRSPAGVGKQSDHFIITGGSLS